MRLFFLSLFCLTFIGCATYTEETRSIRESYNSGQYQKALETLETSSLKDQSNSALLYRLERSMILDRLGEREKSRKDLMQADKIADELFTVSVSKTAASFVVNDGIQDYEGETYEKIAIHTMMALSFLNDQNLKSARIEARKINTKLYEITQEYGDKHNSYKEDAFARFLAGLIYEARGEIDDAIIDYNKAVGLYLQPGYRKYYQGSVPEELITSLYRLAKKRRRQELIARLRDEFSSVIGREENASEKPDAKYGDLVVIHEIGNIAIKKAKEFIFPFGKQVIRFSFPYISRERHQSWGETGVRVLGGPFTKASNVADMNGIAYQCLEDRRGRMLLKGGARLLLKGQLTEKAHEEFGVLGGIAANVFSAVTETADTRSWTLLPEAFYVSRVRLPAGKHQVTIKSGGKFSDAETIQISPGKLTLLRSSDQS